jgi:hypothetical protein
MFGFFDEEKNVEDVKIYEPKKDPSPFDIFTKIFNKTLQENEYKYFNEFLMLNILSNDKSTLKIAEFINEMNMSKEETVKFLMTIMPDYYRYNYPKKPKVADSMLMNICEDEFKVNSQTARRYCKLLSSRDKKTLKNIEKNLKQF